MNVSKIMILVSLKPSLSYDEPDLNLLAVLMRRLDLKEKERRRAESERDNLRDCMEKLCAPDQIRIM